MRLFGAGRARRVVLLAILALAALTAFAWWVSGRWLERPRAVPRQSVVPEGTRPRGADGVNTRRPWPSPAFRQKTQK